MKHYLKVAWGHIYIWYKHSYFENLYLATIDGIKDHFNMYIGYRSAALSFFVITLLVPLMIAVTTILSLLPIDTREFIEIIYRIFPEVPVNIEEAINLLSSVLSQQRSIYGVVGFGTAYFFSSRLFIALHRTLRIIFNIDPGQFEPKWWIQFLSVPIFIIGVIIVSMVSSLISVMMNWLLSTPLIHLLSPKIILTIILNISDSITFMTFFMFLLFLYHFICPRPHKKFKNSIMVTILTGIVFTVLKNGFSKVFTKVTMLNPIYGAFSGVFGFLAWVYISIIVLLIGARVIYHLEEDSYVSDLIRPDTQSKAASTESS